MENLNTINKARVRKDILVIVIPVLMESVFRIAAEVLSASLVGHLSAVATAAQGISLRINSFLNVMWSATRMGSLVYFISLVGESKYDELKKDFKNISTIIIGVALLFTAAVEIFTKPIIVHIFKPEPDIVPVVCNYVRVAVLAIPFIVTRHMCGAAFNSMSDTKTPMVSVLIIDAINLGVGYVLIYVVKIDYFGAAIATFLSELSGCVFLFFMLMRNQHFKETGRVSWKINNPNSIKQTFLKAIPIAIEDGFWQISAILMTRFLLHYGTNDYAAFQLAGSAEEFTQMWIYGFSTSAAALCGKAEGEKNGALFREYFKQQMILNGLISLFMGCIMIFLPNFLMTLVTDVPELKAIGCQYLVVMGIIFIPQNLQYVMKGTIYGSVGKTKVTMFIMGIGIWLIRIPLAALITYVLAWPVRWIFITIATDQVSRFLMMAWYIHHTDIMHYVENKEKEKAEEAIAETAEVSK